MNTSGEYGFRRLKLASLLAFVCALVLLMGLVFVQVGALERFGRAPDDLVYSLTNGTLTEMQRLGPQSWRPVEGSQQRFGNRHPEAWMRFTLRGTSHPSEVNISIGPSLVDFFELHLLRKGEATTLLGGDQRRLEPGVRATNEWSYRIRMEPGETVSAFVHFRNRRRSIGSVRLHTDAELRLSARTESARIGLFVGLLVVLILVAALLAWLGRSVMYAAYLGYLVCAAFTLLDADGMLYQWLGPIEGPWGNNRPNLLTAISAVLLLSFAKSFLNLPRDHWWSLVPLRALEVMRVLSLVYAIVVLIDPPIRHNPVMNVMVLCSILVAIAAGVAAARLKRPEAMLFISGWVAFGLFVSFHQLGALGLHDQFASTTPLHLGVLAEALIFSLALGLRNRSLLHERVLLEARLQQLRRELEQAKQVHRRVLPRELPNLAGLSIDVLYMPESQLGGDLYAFAQFSDQDLVVMVADVTGHGLAAALDSSVVWAAFREASSDSGRPAQILGEMNRFLAPHVDFRFVTACCARIDLSRGRLQVASAGHVPVLVCRREGAEYVGVTGTLLGFDPTFVYDEQTFELQSGDRVLLYSDGLVESQSRANEESGLDALQKYSMELKTEGPRWLEDIVAGMEAWRQEGVQADDVTALCLTVRQNSTES